MGDHDWFKISLTAGQSISVSLDGITLEDSYLRIYDTSGNLLFENDDINPGIVRDSMLAFTATYTGTYYIDAGAWVPNPGEEPPGYTGTGTYSVSVTPYTPPPLATVQQVADQLVSGYWGGDSHHFDVTQGGTITVNLTALTAAGQNLARAALATWTDIIGVKFTEVPTGGQITFDDNEEGAFTNDAWSNGITTSAHVNISTQWLADYGTGLNTYSYQSYIHEIGHALGLGHAGNYNGDARYPYDALFENDSWAVSVMSYFSQTENTYFAAQGFTENFIGTPMISDIIAMSTLYGLSTITRTDDTTYGQGSNAGGVYNATLYPDAAYTIFDSGGIDALNFANTALNQSLNLNSESFSNVLGFVGTVSIVRGTVIENAFSGSGNDTLTGNAVANFLAGGAGNDSLIGNNGDDLLLGQAGNDSLDGGAGSDTASYSDAAGAVTVNLSLSGAQNTVGAGSDTLTSIENLLGSTLNDMLTGDANANVIEGSLGNDTLNGGGGVDTLSYASSNAGVTVSLALAGAQNTGGAGTDTISNFENLSGSQSNDTLTGNSGVNFIWGNGGTNIIDGGAGADQMYGGSGSDTFYVDDAGDQVFEVTSPGTDFDSVVTSLSYTLGVDLEGLTLTGSANINGAGNSANNYIGGNGGNNILDGGGGSDFATYLAAGSGVTVSLAIAGPQNTIGAGTDTLLNFENLFGSLFNDTLTGDSGNNHLTGYDGNDTLEGGAGDDYLDGGAGINTASYVSAAAGVVVTAGLGPSVQDTVGAGVDTLVGIFNLTGSAFSDTLNGSLSGNVLIGGGGNDILTGGGGLDTLTGGTGNDSFKDSKAGLGGDTISDFAVGDKIVITDASLAGFNFSLSGNTLTYTGGSLTLTGFTGRLTAAAAVGGGVQLTLDNHATNDFNGDGRSDILWRNEGSGNVTSWFGQANGSFAGNSASFIAGTNWSVAGTGDFNGDGRDDVLWRNQGTGVVTDWLGQANGSFVGNTASFTAGNDWSVVGTGDFNGDGRDDVLWRNNGTGVVTDWLGQANGSFVGNTASFTAGTNWSVVGTGDFNGDGRDDVLWRNNGTGNVTDWLGQANGTFAGNTASFTAGTNWSVVGTGDFNGDGRDDVLWRNNGTGVVTDWLGQANGSFVGNTASFTAGNDWSVASTGDFNGDGRDDVLWRSDAGVVTDWLGQANGGFAGNLAIAHHQITDPWHVQPDHNLI